MNIKELVEDYDEFEKKIVNIAKTKFEIKKTIKYKVPEIKDNTYKLNPINNLKIEKEYKDNNCGYVYGIYDSNDKLLYIGSTKDLCGRLRKHLRSNKSFKVEKDGKKETDSVIDLVYEHINKITEDEKRYLKYSYFKVEPWYFYTSVEDILIERLDPKWNVD